MRRPLWAAFVAGVWLGVATAEAREQLRQALRLDRERTAAVIAGLRGETATEIPDADPRDEETR